AYRQTSKTSSADRRMVLKRSKALSLGFPALVSQGSLALWGVISILIARQLPDDAYAAYALARSIEMFAGLLGGGFVLQALLKLGSEKQSRQTSATANTAMLVTLVFSILVSCLMLLFGGSLNSFYPGIPLQGITPLIAVVVFTGSLAHIPRNLLLTRLSTAKVMQADLVSFLIRGGIVGWLIYTGTLTGAVQVLKATALANVGAFLINSWNVRRIFEPSAGVNRTALNRVLGFAVFSLGTSFAGFIYTRTDILMLGKLAPPEDVAAYSASRALTSMVVMVSAAANMVLMPAISRDWTSGLRKSVMKRSMKAIGIVQLIQLPVVVALVFFPRQIIDLIYHGRYSENWPILAILGGLALVRPFGSIFSTASAAMNKPQYSFWCILLSAGVNVTLNIILIPTMGGIGAAWATVAAVVSGAAAIVFLSTRHWRKEA
ncbi:MAG: oligosaccharide flippase family protein, partial [Candidatus Sabulitectum sp.]|nr:oligosaccharide flippase family protein [Candidatus Sabulitectum sp.]